MKNVPFYQFDSNPRFPRFLLYVRCRFGVTIYGHVSVMQSTNIIFFVNIIKSICSQYVKFIRKMFMESEGIITVFMIRPNMTEKLLTGMLSLNTNKQSCMDVAARRAALLMLFPAKLK